MKIRLDPLDKIFSKDIRLRDKVCQRCGSSGNLQCSHFHGRRKRSVRYDEDNCMALCMGCHMYFGANPLEHTEFMIKRLGQDKFDMLAKRAQTPQKIDREMIKLYYESKIREVSNE